MHRHKLNLLRPGKALCAVLAVLLLAGLILQLCGVSAVAVWLWMIAAAVFVLLLILLGIEQHQDRMLYLQAKQEDPRIE